MALIKKQNIKEKDVFRVKNSFNHDALVNKVKMIEKDEEIKPNQDEAESEMSKIEIEQKPILEPISKISTDSGNLKKMEAKVDELNQEYENLKNSIKESKASAEEEIFKLKSQAEEEAQQLKITSKENGYKEGLEEAKAIYAEKSSDVVLKIGGLLKEKERIFKGAEKELLKLSVNIAEQLIKSEISYNQDVILNIVTEAISKITDRDRVIVRVSRQEYEFVQNNRNRIMNLMDDVKNLVVQEDSAIDAGGCIIETELGYIDSRISLKLDAINFALNKAYDDLHFDEALSEPDSFILSNDKTEAPLKVKEEIVIENDQLSVEDSKKNVNEEVAQVEDDVYDDSSVVDKVIESDAKSSSDDLFSDDAFDDDDDDFFDFDDDDDDDFWG